MRMPRNIAFICKWMNIDKEERNLDKRIIQIEQTDNTSLRRIVANIRDYIRDRRTNYEYASACHDDQ